MYEREYYDQPRQRVSIHDNDVNLYTEKFSNKLLSIAEQFTNLN